MTVTVTSFVGSAESDSEYVIVPFTTLLSRAFKTDDFKTSSGEAGTAHVAPFTHDSGSVEPDGQYVPVLQGSSTAPHKASPSGTLVMSQKRPAVQRFGDDVPRGQN